MSRFSIRLSGLLTIVAAGACAIGASSLAVVQQGCAEKAPQPSAPEPIRVGVMFGLTGSLETFTAPLRDAVRAAEGTINSNGGVLGRPLRFEIVDDKSDEDTFVQDVARDLVSRGVVAVIGPVGSQQVVQTHEIFAQANIVQISPSATSTVLTTIQDRNNRFLFRTTPADDFQGAAVILFARRGPAGLDGGVPEAGAPQDAGADASPDGGGGGPISSCSKLAIVNIDNAYGNSMADVIEQNFPKFGGTIAIRKVVSTVVQSNYTAEASEVLGLEPDCLALIAYDDVATQFVRDVKLSTAYPPLEQRGFFIIGTDGVYTSGFLVNSREDKSVEVSPNTAEGVYGTNPDTQPVTSPAYNEFKTIFSAYSPLRPGEEAPAFASNTFDAAILIALAVQKAKDPKNGVAIRDALLSISSRGSKGRPFRPSEIGQALIAARDGQEFNYTGASGEVDFDADGNVTAGFIIWQAVRDPVSRLVDYKTVGRFAVEDLEAQIQ